MSNRTIPLALMASALSGAAALTHELLWTRRLIDLLGATHEASARVIACFFLGLSLGAAFVVLAFKRSTRPWRMAAGVELAVALFCLPVLFLPELYAGMWQQLGPDQLISTAGMWAKLGISVAVVVPPAFFMGMTIPLMAEGVLRSRGNLPAPDLWLYALNTAGGFLGILLTTDGLLWWFGVRGAILTAMFLNMVVAALCLRLDRQRSAVTTSSPTDSSRKSQPTASGRSNVANLFPPPLALGMMMAFISGVCVLSIEVLSIHLFSHVISTFHATAAVLAAFIAMLFLSALVVPNVVPRYASARQALPPLLMAAALAVVVIPFVFMFVTNDLGRTYEGFGSSWSFIAAIMFSTTLTTGMAVFLSGMVFPLSVLVTQTSAGPALRCWGLLLAANGVGGALGAETANNLLMTRCGLYPSFAVMAAIYGAVALLLCLGDRSNRSWLKISMAAGGTVILLSLTPLLSSLPIVARQESARLLDVNSGPDGVLAVVERDFDLPIGRHVSRAIIWNSQYTLGGTLSRYDEQRQAVLPLIMHPQPKSVAFLGLATGITAGTALDMPGVERVTVIELSPQVVECAADYFAGFNRHICDDRRAEVVVEDARTYVAACENKFDVVVGDLFRPYSTGEGRLFTVEHFRSAKRSLRDGGLYAHWLPCHQLDQTEFEVILSSFLEVFDEVELWRVNLKSQVTAVGLFGFKNGRLTFAGLDARCQQLRREGKILDPPSRHAESIAMHYIGQLQSKDARSQQLNTLNNIWLELNCGLRYSVQDAHDSSLADANWPRFEEDLYQRVAGHPSAAGELSRWRAVGRKVSKWYHAASRGDADQAQLLKDAQDSLPTALSNDADADWTFWPAY